MTPSSTVPSTPDIDLTALHVPVSCAVHAPLITIPDGPHTDSMCVQGKEEATEAALSLLLDTGLGEDGWVPSGDKKGVKIFRRNDTPFTSLKGTGRHRQQGRAS